MIALDIWAGNTTFWKQLKLINPQIKTVFCWDPIFRPKEYDLSQSILSNILVFLSRFSKVLSVEEINEVIEKSKSWVYKIIAEYKKIPLEDNFLDLVTLNSPHPLMYPGKVWFDEFRRVLKPGWVFYFGHSKSINLEFDEKEFKLIWSGEFYYGWWNIAKLPLQNLDFTMSPVMKNNLIVSEMLKKWLMKNRPWYIYWAWPTKIALNPNWKAWQKL